MKVIGDDSSKIILTNFISQRQSEIIRELKTMYDAITKFDQKQQQ